MFLLCSWASRRLIYPFGKRYTPSQQRSRTCCKNRLYLSFPLMTEWVLLCILYFLFQKKVGDLIFILHCLLHHPQNILHSNHLAVTEVGLAWPLVHHHQPKGHILLFWGGSKTQEVSVFCLHPALAKHQVQERSWPTSTGRVQLSLLHCWGWWRTSEEGPQSICYLWRCSTSWDWKTGGLTLMSGGSTPPYEWRPDQKQIWTCSGKAGPNLLLIWSNMHTPTVPYGSPWLQNEPPF